MPIAWRLTVRRQQGKADPALKISQSLSVTGGAPDVVMLLNHVPFRDGSLQL